MSNDEYLRGIIYKYTVDSSGAENAAKSLYRLIDIWANGCLTATKLSGSLAKGTAISLGTDADNFISLSSSTTGTLSQK